jgi:hypothetical protein
MRMNRRLPLAAIASLLLLFDLAGIPWAAAAQEANGVPVQMIVTVEARHGAEVPTIGRGDVLVQQDHSRRQVTGWTAFEPTNPALELYITIDDALDGSFGSQMPELQKFINAQPGTTSVGIAYMRAGAANILQTPTTDHAKAAQAVRLPLGAATLTSSPYEAIADLIKKWPQSSARHEVLMISSGIEPFGPLTSDNPEVNSAIASAQRAGVPVFTIYFPGVGHWGHTLWRLNWAQSYLSQLADESRGEGYWQGTTNPVTIAPYLSDVQRKLHNQYQLTFLAEPQSKAGLVPVKITTEVPRIDLVAADKVFVPAR